MNQIVLYRCQRCGGPRKIVTLPWAREVVFTCGGQLDPIHVLRAFEDGAFGVCAAFCDPAVCRTLSGAAAARRRLDYAARLLEEIGVARHRLKAITVTAGSDLNNELMAFREELSGKEATP